MLQKLEPGIEHYCIVGKEAQMYDTICTFPLHEEERVR